MSNTSDDRDGNYIRIVYFNCIIETYICTLQILWDLKVDLQVVWMTMVTAWTITMHLKTPCVARNLLMSSNCDIAQIPGSNVLRYTPA